MLFDKLLFLAMVVLFGVGAVRVILDSRRAAQSRGWRPVSGRVESSQPIVRHMTTGRTARVWLPRIQYVYEVGGRDYRGDVLTYGRDRWYTSVPDRARERCGEYPVGASVTVWFDPARPDLSCLERARGSLWLNYVVAAALGGASLVLAWFQRGVW